MAITHAILDGNDDFIDSPYFKVVTAEILMASETGCPLEVHKISIDRCDEMFDEDCHGDTWMPFYRDDDELDLGRNIRQRLIAECYSYTLYQQYNKAPCIVCSSSFRAMYDSGTGQSPNSPREQVYALFKK